MRRSLKSVCSSYITRVSARLPDGPATADIYGMRNSPIGLDAFSLDPRRAQLRVISRPVAFQRQAGASRVTIARQHHRYTWRRNGPSMALALYCGVLGQGGYFQCQRSIHPGRSATGRPSRRKTRSAQGRGREESEDRKRWIQNKTKSSKGSVTYANPDSCRRASRGSARSATK